MGRGARFDGTGSCRLRLGGHVRTVLACARADARDEPTMLPRSAGVCQIHRAFLCNCLSDFGLLLCLSLMNFFIPLGVCAGSWSFCLHIRLEMGLWNRPFFRGLMRVAGVWWRRYTALKPLQLETLVLLTLKCVYIAFDHRDNNTVSVSVLVSSHIDK